MKTKLNTMEKLEPKDVWVEENKENAPIVVSTVGGRLEKQSGYFFTKEELEAVIIAAWEQCDKTAEELTQYPYGKHGGYKEPCKENYIYNLLYKP